LPQSPYFSLETGRVADPTYEPIEVSAWNSLRIYLVAHVKGSHRGAPIRTLGNHKIARGSVKPRQSVAGGVPTRPITIDPVSAGNRNREGASKPVGSVGVRQMSDVINFQGDAMECLRMAERAKGREEKSVLMDLARAWVLLGEQLRHLHDGANADSPKPKSLN
jgi:hypothetical protein